MSISCFIFVVSLSFEVDDDGDDGSVVIVVVVMMAPISVRSSFRRSASEYMVSSIQKNVGVALTSTAIRSPISKRATSSTVPPLLIAASWRTFSTPRPYLWSPRLRYSFMALWSFRRPAKPFRAVYLGKSPRMIMVKSFSKSLIHVSQSRAQYLPCIFRDRGKLTKKPWPVPVEDESGSSFHKSPPYSQS